MPKYSREYISILWSEPILVIFFNIFKKEESSYAVSLFPRLMLSHGYISSQKIYRLAIGKEEETSKKQKVKSVKRKCRKKYVKKKK